MIKLLFIIFLAMLINILFAQDEFYFRKMFLKKRLANSKQGKKKAVYDLQVNSPMYKIDLNDDKYKEGIIYHKDNGSERLHIVSHKHQLIKSFEMDSVGKNPSLQRILIKRLSSNVKVLILYFYAGEQEYIEYKGRGRFYFINIENGDLNKMQIFKGPNFWSEVKDAHGNYHRRHYSLEIKDLNGDGLKEVIVKYSKISRICFYREKGRWHCN